MFIIKINMVNMKKVLLSLAFICLTAGADAQNVYNEIRKNASDIVANPATNNMVRQINQFKVDALDYMIIKMREQMPDSSAIFLDKQAYAMNTFINVYIRKVLDNKDMPQAQIVKIMQFFMDVSYSNPLFNDPDKELTLGYYSNGKCLTRFSLDTDWRRAVAAVAMEMK